MNDLVFLLKNIEDILCKLDVWQLKVQKYWKQGEGQKKLQKFKKTMQISFFVVLGLAILGSIGMIVGLIKQSYIMILASETISIIILLFAKWAGRILTGIISEGGSILKQTAEPAKKLAEKINEIFKPFVSVALVIAFIGALTILIGFQNYNKFWVIAAIATSIFFLVQGLYFETDNKLLGKGATAFVVIGILCFYTRYPLDPVTAKLFGCGDVVKTVTVKTPHFKIEDKAIVLDSAKMVNAGDSVQVIDQRNLWKMLNGEKMVAARLPDSATGRFILPDTVWLIANDLKKTETKTILPRKNSYGKGEYPLSLKKGDRFKFTVNPNAKGYWFNTANCQNDSLEIYTLDGRLLMQTWLPNQNLNGLPRSGEAVAKADMDNVVFSVN